METQVEDPTQVMLSREEILSYALSVIETYLSEESIINYDAPTVDTPLSRKEFLYRSWLLASREIETSAWSGSVVEGTLVVKGDIQADGHCVYIECDDTTLTVVNSMEDALGNMAETFSVVVGGNNVVYVDLTISKDSVLSGLFTEICLSILELMSKLVSICKITCNKDDIKECIITLEALDCDSDVIEVPKRPQPANT